MSTLPLCSACGAPLPPVAQFCMSCGVSRNAAQAPAPPLGAQPSQTTTAAEDARAEADIEMMRKMLLGGLQIILWCTAVFLPIMLLSTSWYHITHGNPVQAIIAGIFGIGMPGGALWARWRWSIAVTKYTGILLAAFSIAGFAMANAMIGDAAGHAPHFLTGEEKEATATIVAYQQERAAAFTATMAAAPRATKEAAALAVAATATQQAQHDAGVATETARQTTEAGYTATPIPPPTNTPIPSATATDQEINRRITAQIDGVFRSVENGRGLRSVEYFGYDQKVINIEFDVDDNLTNGLIRLGAKDRVRQYLLAASRLNMRYDSLRIFAHFPVGSPGLDTQDTVVFRVFYNYETVNRYHWDDLTVGDGILDMADDKHIHPAFLK